MQSSKEKQGEIKKQKQKQKKKKTKKKTFFSDQCKETEENNRMGKTRNFFKKIRDTKETFHAKMGTIRTEMVWT